jgi:hypothetical protein
VAAFPTITNGFVITTGTPNVSYNQIVNSLMSWQYKMKQLYIYANDLNQLTNTFTFIKQNPDGTASSLPDSITASPYQLQSAYYWDFSGGDVIFDNTTVFQFQLNPYAFMQMMFYVDFNTAGNTLQPR